MPANVLFYLTIVGNLPFSPHLNDPSLDKYAPSLHPIKVIQVKDLYGAKPYFSTSNNKA
jgi:hypothetical protein